MKVTHLKFLGILIVGLLTQEAAFAENKVHFNLNAQHFSEALKDGGMVMARYELPDSYVATNLKYGSAYTTLNDTGFLSVELKKPLLHWGIAFDLFCSFDASHTDTRSITLTADNGVSIMLGLTYRHIAFNGQTVYKPNENERMAIAFDRNSTDNKINLTVNGKPIDAVAMPNFGKLNVVEVQLIQEQTNGRTYDALHGLVIGGQ